MRAKVSPGNTAGEGVCCSGDPRETLITFPFKQADFN